MKNELINKLKDYKIAVLAGGPSNEREVSLKSGRAVEHALSSMELAPVFIDVVDECMEIDKNIFDIAFLALHGRFGEDGTVQKKLAQEGKLYTGSGPESSRAALDKIDTKKILFNSGIMTPEYVELTPEKGHDHLWKGGPLVVKPRYEGSSIGLSVVRSRIELSGAVNKAFASDDSVLAEEFIDGREITVGILEDSPLPVVEILAPAGIYDYDAKYKAVSTRYMVPAEIDPELCDKIQEIALRAHRALGCTSFSRVDMRVREDDVFVLEVNTIPGLTERSLLPMAASSAGTGFDELCLKILLSAMPDMVKK